MNKERFEKPISDVTDWWQTAIIDMVPGKIDLRGHPIETLIGSTSFIEMVWLLTRGTLPTKPAAQLLEAAMVAAVDHGPQAPSIATARMAVTCGVNLNGAMASAINMLDDIHGGAGQQAVILYHLVKQEWEDGQTLEEATQKTINDWQQTHSKFIPGFGHRFHKPQDPRAPKLLALVDDAQRDGVVSGKFSAIGRAIETRLNLVKGQAIPMNIDGATAVIFAELGFAPELARGLFCLSRAVGILAHAWEQMNQGGRNKGPTPPNYYWTYTGKSDNT